MNLHFLRLHYLTFLFLSIFFFSGKLAFSQAVYSGSSTGVTLTQQEVDVAFTLSSGSIGFSDTAPHSLVGWAVTVGVTPVTIISVNTFGASAIRVKFDASTAPGHAPTEPYLKPGDVVTVTYLGGGTVTAAGGVTPFSGKTAVNNAVFDCATDVVYTSEQDYGTVNQCAQVNMNFHWWIFTYSLRYRNSSTWNAPGLRVEVVWGDGASNNWLPTQCDNTGAASSTYIGATSLAGNPGVLFVVKPTHLYPLAVAGAAPNECHFNASVTPYINTSSFCNSAGTSHSFTSYSTDNKLSGNLGNTQLPVPFVANTDKVCRGNNVNMMFNDITTMNCSIAADANFPNTSTRWVRILYGSQNGASGNIPNVNITLPASMGGTTIPVTDASGTLIYPSGYYPTTGNAPLSVNNVPDNFGVIQVPYTGSAPPTGTAFMGTITTTSPVGQAVNQTFWIQLQYWNVCNAYTGDPTNPAPVTASAAVTIIASDNAPVVSPLTFCANQGNATYSMTATATPDGTGTFKWYSDAALSVLRQTGASYNPVTTAPNLSKNPANATSTTFYVTETVGNGCVSPTATVSFTIDPTVVPGSIVYSGLTPQCNGYDPPSIFGDGIGGVAVHGAVATKGDGVTYTYQWQDSPDNITFTNIAGQTGLNFDPPVLTATRYYKRVASSGVCASVASNVITIQIDQLVNGGTIGGGTATICTGSAPAGFTSATLPTGGNGTFTYQWQFSTVSSTGPWSNAPGVSTNSTYTSGALTQTTYFQRVATSGSCTPPTGASNPMTVVVNQAVSPGTVSGNQSICSGQTPTPLTSVLGASGGDGSIYTYLWQQSTTSSTGPWSSAGGANTGVNYSPPALTVTTFYQRVATSGLCAAQAAGPITVTVNPLPTAATPTGGGAVCSGNPAPDINWTLTGTAPFNITYTMTPGGPVVVSGWPTNTFTITAPNPGVNTTYQITALSDANTCIGTAFGGTASVTIGGNAPAFATAPSVTPTSTCDNGVSTTDPQLNFNLTGASSVAGTYTLTYKIDGGSSSTKNFTVNLGTGAPAAPITFSEVALNATAPSPHVITVVSILTPFGCQTVFNTTVNFTVNPLPAAPVGATGAVSCSTAGTGSQLSVTDPGAGFTVLWSTTAAPTYTPATGVLAGSNNHLFTPSSNATVTYFTFVQNNTTSCSSSTSTAVTNTQDLPPAAATITAPTSSPFGVCALVTGNGAATPLTATAINGVDKGTWSIVSGAVGGTAITSPNSTSTAITGLPGDTPAGGTVKTVVVKWNVQSKFGQLGTANACPDNSAQTTININPLPTSIDPTPQLCEDVLNGHSHAHVDLTSYNASVTNAPTVTWWTNPAHTSAASPATDVTVNTTTAKTFYFIATSATNCVNTGTLTFTVNSLPTVVNQNLSFCEDHVGVTPIPPHSNTHGPFDLTTYNTAIANGSLVNRTVTWYSDVALTTLVPTPASYTLTGSVTLYAKVVDTSNPTNCFNTATVNLTTLPRPKDNPIQGNTSVCTGNNILLYQLDPTFNAGSNYTWTVTGTPAADVNVFGGGGTNSSNFFVLLKFPAATGTVNIDVVETLNGCTGNHNTMTVNVNSAPAANTITSTPLLNLTEVCSGQTLVPYSVATPNVTSSYTWLVTGATPSGSGSTINVDYGTIPSVSIQVTETSSSGCVGAPASIGVTVNPRPAMSSATNPSVCSGVAPTLAFQAGAIPSTFSWVVTNISGSVTGATIAQTGSGNLSATFTGVTALKNVSGAAGFVTFNVTPTAIASPNCAGDPQTVVLTVNPEPVMSSPAVYTICSGGTPATFTANVPATIFSWTVTNITGSTVSGASISDTGSGNITQTLTNTTNTSAVVTYNVIPVSSSPALCTGTNQTLIVTVLPTPQMTSAAATTVCSENTPGITFTSNTGGTFAWSVTNVTAGISGTAVGNTGTGNITQTLVNKSGASGTVTYQVTPTGPTPSNCPGIPQILTVTVLPEPVMTSLNTALTCSQVAPTLVFTSNVPGATYAWTVINISGAVTGTTVASNGSGNLNQVIKNNSGANATVTYRVTPTGPGAPACSGAFQDVVLTINPEPNMTSLNSNTICGGAMPTLVFTADIAASTFAWKVVAKTGTIGGANINDTGSGNINQTLTNTSGVAGSVSYQVTPTSPNNCTGQFQTVTINVIPQPNMTSANATSICSGTTPASKITFTADVALSTFAWTVTSITGAVSGTAVGNVGTGNIGQVLTNTSGSNAVVTYQVTPTSPAPNSCTGFPQTVNVTVNPEPVITNTLTDLNCSGTLPAFVLTSNVAGSTFAWQVTAISGTVGGTTIGNIGSGNINEPLTNTSGTNGTVTYLVTPTGPATGNCVGQAKSVIRTVFPAPVITSSATDKICSGHIPGLTFASNLTGTTFAWKVTGITGTVTGTAINNTGTGNLSETLTNKSGAIATVTYHVTPTGPATNFCAGVPQDVVVTVVPEPVITSAPSDQFCSENMPSVVFASNVAGTSFAWVVTNITGTLTGTVNGSNGTGNINQVLVNTSGSSATVTYQVTPTGPGPDNCTGQAQTFVVTVLPEPVITINNNNPICSGNVPSLSITSNVAGSTFGWQVLAVSGVTGTIVGNAGTGNTISDILKNTTGSSGSVTYRITPAGPNPSACPGSHQDVVVTVIPEPVITNSLLPPAICSGATPASTVSFTSNVAGSTFNWTVQSITGSVTGTSIGFSGSGNITTVLKNISGSVGSVFYQVTPIGPAASLCAGQSQIVEIDVNPEPVGAPTTTITKCSGDPINFDLQSIVNNTGGGGNSVLSNFTYTVVADLPNNLSPAVFPGVFDRTAASNAQITNAFSNYSTGDVTLTFTVTPISTPQNCTGGTFVLKVIIHPEPVGSNFNDPLCATVLNHNMQTQITNGITSLFTYTVSSDNGGVAPAANRTIASNAFITDVYTNNTGVVANLTYTITAKSSSYSCVSSAPFTYVAQIFPTPVGGAGSAGQVCSNATFSINPQTFITNGVTITKYDWTATYNGLTVNGAAPSTGLTGTTGSISMALTNLTAGPLSAVFHVTPYSGNCPGTTFDITQPVNPQPFMNPPLANPAAICSTNSASTNGTGVVLATGVGSVTAASYNVTLKSQDAGLVGTPTVGAALGPNAIKNDTYQNTTAAQLKVVYTVVPVGSIGGCLGASFDITILVNPESVLFAPVVPAVCSTNISNPVNPIGVILGTNGTSAAAASYKLIQAIQYSNGGPFSTTLPTNFSIVSATVLNATGDQNMIKSDTYRNTSAVSVTVRYGIQATSSSGCLSVPLNYDIVINPEPTLSPGTVTVCSGAAPGALFNLGPAGGSVAISQYNLKQILIQTGLTPAGTNAGLGVYSTNNFLDNDQFVNTTSGQLTVTYTIDAVSGSGCIGLDQTVILKVNPAPALTAGLNTTVCSNSISGIILQSATTSVLATSFNITIVAVSAGLIQTAGNSGARVGVASGEIKNDKFTNPTNNPLTVTYTIVPVSAAPCLGPPTDIILTIEPAVTAVPVAPSSICSNTPTNFTLSSLTVPTTGPITFSYTAVSSVGGLITGFQPSVSNLPNNTTINDVLVNNSTSHATVTYTVTPVANGAAGGSGCMGTPPTVVVVTVDPLPKLIVSPSIQTVCEGTASNVVLTTTTIPSAGTIQFNVLSATPTGGMTLTSPAVPVTTYTNSQSIADAWSNPTIVQQTVAYVLQPVVSGGLGCVGSNVNVTLNVNPRPVVTNSSQAPICTNDFVNIVLTPDVSGTIDTWTASVTAGTTTGQAGGSGDLIFQTLKNTGSIPANVRYTVTPKAAGCTGNPLNIDVEVDPIPNVVFTQPIPVCYGSTLTVPLTSAVAGTNFNWVVDPNNSGVPTASASGTTISQVVADTLTSSEDFISYTITAVGPGVTACASAPKIMNVIASPVMAGVFANDSTWLCTITSSSNKDLLNIDLKGQAPFTMQYTDGTTTFTLNGVGNAKFIPIQPAVSTTYKLLTLKDALGCSIPLTSQVAYTVGKTNAEFNIISSLAACTPDVTLLQYNQVANNTYKWIWGDGTPDSTYTATTDVSGKTISHRFINSSLTSTLKTNVFLYDSLGSRFPDEGCQVHVSRPLSVYAQLKTSVSIDKSLICSGDVVKINNQTIGALSTGHNWFYRELGNTGQQLEVRTTANVNYTLSVNTTQPNPQVYEIVYNVTNGHCPADTTIQVTVYKSMTANFTDVVPFFVGGNAAVTFNNTSVATADWPSFQFDWDFGIDATPPTLTSSTTPLVVNYSSPGPRDVTLTATNVAALASGLTCSNSITKTISILLAPLIAEFKLDPKKVCYPANIKVTENLSTGNRYTWTVTDDTGIDTVATSNAALPVFSISSDGNYIVNLLTSNSFTGQTATDTAHVILYPKPTPIFDAFPTTVYIPDQAVSVRNGSGATANEYLWEFGDGNTSTDFQPDPYKYKFEGVDSLKFTAKYDHGGGIVCSETSFIIVIAKQGGVAKVPNAFTPNTAGPNGGVGGIDLYNYVFLPQVKGVEEFNMQIYDRWGNLIFESTSQSVGWDGYDQHGKLLPAGVYVYKLTLRLSDQQRTTQIGDVTLIR